MTQLTLRPYQREAIDNVFKAWSGGMQRPAIVLPTGAGKTVVFSALVREWGRRSAWRQGVGPRVMILAHRDELIDQAIAKLRSVMPGVNVGKVKAEDNDVYADVMVCSVQTLASARRRDQVFAAQSEWRSKNNVGLIITDECHHAAAASYKKIYDAFPDALQLGVTATLERGDGVGLGSTWDDVVFKRSTLWMIAKGYLCDVRTRRVDLKSLDMGTVSVSRGDWVAGDLGRALMEAEADTAIARAYKEHAGDRQGIVFTPTVETAMAACVALNKAQISCDVVHGETPRETRLRMFEKYRRGELQVLVNCMVLTEGFDMPQAEVAVIARPTRSAPLYTQMVGRVLRPYPGKKEALVLDLVGASAHKLRTLIDLEPGSVQSVREGESLAEAVVREEEARNGTVTAGSPAFELKVRDVESFASSEHAWIRTSAGVLFINCGDRKVFLWPSQAKWGGNRRDQWDVCVYTPGEPWKRVEPHVNLDLSSAMAWGEAVSEDYGISFGVARTAAWRKRPASAAMKSKAKRYGIDPGALRAGELSDALNKVLGSQVFDRFVGKG